MNINLTLSRKNENGDIPTFTFQNLQIDLNQEYANVAQMKLYDWIKTIDFNNSVLVCFETFRNEIDFKNEVDTILVSHNWDEIVDFCESILGFKYTNDVNFSIFEFESYKDAFEYCIDLRESF